MILERVSDALTTCNEQKGGEPMYAKLIAPGTMDMGSEIQATCVLIGVQPYGKCYGGTVPYGFCWGGGAPRP